MSTIERIAAQVAALQRRVAELETRDRQIAVPASGGTFSGNLAVGAGTGERRVLINGGAGSVRDLVFQTGGVDRWIVRTNGTGESGSNAGSNLEIISRNDAGAGIANVITAVRATGYVTLVSRLYAAGLRTAPGSPDAGEIYVDGGGFLKRG